MPNLNRINRASIYFIGGRPMTPEDWELLAYRDVTVIELTGDQFHVALHRTGNSVTPREQPLVDAAQGWFVQLGCVRGTPMDGPFPTIESALVGAISGLAKYITYNEVGR